MKYSKNLVLMQSSTIQILRPFNLWNVKRSGTHFIQPESLTFFASNRSFSCRPPTFLCHAVHESWRKNSEWTCFAGDAVVEVVEVVLVLEVGVEVELGGMNLFCRRCSSSSRSCSSTGTSSRSRIQNEPVLSCSSSSISCISTGTSSRSRIGWNEPVLLEMQ